VDAFLINWKKIQLFEYVDNTGINANGGTATSKGFEWSFGLTPVEGLNLTLTGAYVDAYLTADAPAAGGLDGNQLPYAPKWTDSLDAAYTWKVFADYNAFAGATWSYIGSRASDFSSTPNIVNNAIIFEPNPRADLGGYNTLNLRAGLDNGRWTFSLYCKNIADTRGLAYYTSTGTPNFGGALTIQQPRTIGATIDLHL
jgi:iron complex outermembrane recepter protein